MNWSVPYPQIWFTFGPATNDPQIIKQLLYAGATGARLTFSYGTPQLQIERSQLIRRIAADIGRSVFLVADLQGEKSRFAQVVDAYNHEINEIMVTENSRIILTSRDNSEPYSTPPKLRLQNPDLIDRLTVGDSIIEGDGQLELNVEEKGPNYAVCLVKHEGAIHPGRGLIVRSHTFTPKCITSKDRSDLEAIVSSNEFDEVALSFVSSTEDIALARNIMISIGETLPIIAKIETPHSVERVNEIVTVADALMAARGDLALTSPWTELPTYVNKISQAAKEHNKPWILATQLVEGLERFTFPTRAEICDLAHWILEGAYGAMLSYETAFGRHPVNAVMSVNEIIKRYKA